MSHFTISQGIRSTHAHLNKWLSLPSIILDDFLLFYSQPSHLPTLGLHDPHTHPAISPPSAVHSPALSLVFTSLWVCAQGNSSSSNQSKIIIKKTSPSTRPHFSFCHHQAFPLLLAGFCTLSLMKTCLQGHKHAPKSDRMTFRQFSFFQNGLQPLTVMPNYFFRKHLPRTSSVAPWPRLPSPSLSGPVSSSHLKTLHVDVSSSTDLLLPNSRRWASTPWRPTRMSALSASYINRPWVRPLTESWKTNTPPLWKQVTSLQLSFFDIYINYLLVNMFKTYK